VTGALSKLHVQNNSHWFFCGVHGDSMTELEFEMKHGKCHPGVKVTAHQLCYETPLLVSFIGVLTLSNVGSDSLTTFETTLLENDIAESVSSIIPGLHGAVVVDSAVVSGFDLDVTFTIQFDPSMLGLSGVHYNDMDKLAEQLGAAATSFADNGNFLKFMKTGLLSASSGVADILSSATAVTVKEIEYKGTTLPVHKAAGVDVATGTDTEVAASNFDLQSKTLESFEHSVFLAVAIVFGGLALAFVAMRLGKASTSDVSNHGTSSVELLTDESSRSEEFGKEMLPERSPNYA